MADDTTIWLKRAFVEDVEAYLEDEPFGSVKEFVKHLVLREMESEETISVAEGPRHRPDAAGPGVRRANPMTGSDRRNELPDRPSRYDALLLAMSVAFVATFLVVRSGALGDEAPLAAAAVSSGALDVVGLFESPPTEADGS